MDACIWPGIIHYCSIKSYCVNLSYQFCCKALFSISQLCSTLDTISYKNPVCKLSAPPQLFLAMFPMTAMLDMLLLKGTV